MGLKEWPEPYNSYSGGRDRWISKFKGSLLYMMNSRTARKCCLKKTKQEKLKSSSKQPFYCLKTVMGDGRGETPPKSWRAWVDGDLVPRPLPLYAWFCAVSQCLAGPGLWSHAVAEDTITCCPGLRTQCCLTVV